MTLLLALGVIILGVLLQDTRGRLRRLEEAVRSETMRRGNRVREAEILAPLPQAPAIVEPAEELAVPPEPVETLLAPAGEAPLPVEPSEEPAVAAPEQPQPVAEPASSGFGFEDLFGRKLPIWAGGITLLVAGVLLVRYSIDAGLLSPAVRVFLGLALGAGLVGGAELARRREDVVQDARIAQSLAGAGIGSLYAAVLAATNLYGLIGPAAAFAGLAAITGGAMVLALRFGAPSAVLGLIGGLAAPALVQSTEPSMPLLAGYIAILVGGLTLLSRRQRWAWLGISALVGGAGWSLLMILTGTLDSLSTLSIGLLVILLGIGLPVLAAEQRFGSMLRYAAATVAALQLALLVAKGDFAPLTWGLYGLLSLAFVWLSGRMPALRTALIVPLFTALALLALWPHPAVAMFAAVLAGIVLIYGGNALWHLRRAAQMPDAVALAAIALAGYAVSRWQFSADDTTFALLAPGFALLPAAGVALAWLGSGEREGEPFALQAFAGALLVAVAALTAFPEWTAPASLAAVAAVTAALARKAANRWLARGALLLQASAILALAATGHSGSEFTRLVATKVQAALGEALLRWGAVAAAALGLAWIHARTRVRIPAQLAAALLGYGFAAQLLPAPWLAVVCAVALVLLAEAMRRRPVFAVVPALAVLGALSAAWAVAPLGQWGTAALLSLAGRPMLVTSLPDAGMAARRLLVPAVLAGIALWRGAGRFEASARRLAAGGTGAVALIGLHILYKQLFALGDAARFVSLGLAERTVWEALLVGAGFALWKAGRSRAAALACVGAGLAHALFYTALLHDPLWSRQAVGPLPLANLLLPAYGLAFAALVLVPLILPERRALLHRAADFIRMPAIVLFAFALLRQAFAGSIPAGVPVGSVENIGWSILAVALAIGFLLWGIRRGERDWRIASLVLMLAAVAKVFFVDASGLEGLLRIASFLALGFSLIGIGWLYSRYLRPGGAAG